MLRVIVSPQTDQHQPVRPSEFNAYLATIFLVSKALKIHFELILRTEYLLAQKRPVVSY